MTSDRFGRVKELFVAVYEMPPDERAAFLSRACGEDDALRREVEELLTAHDEHEALAPGDTSAAPLSVAGFKVLRKIGEGGMGEVFEAEQTEPVRRRVALKLVKWGMDSKEVVARFETERQALGLMSHPNVARVLDAGATEQGRPYIAMELVNGVPITDYCDLHRLRVPDRLELLVQVCHGVQHAHQKGVIHRDIKPSNILVALQDERAVPKIIDFGVAKATSQRLTERTLFTQLGQWIGTPEYMSPEQAGVTVLDVDTRTDVYSLGVVTYELLVGAPPFDPAALRGAGYEEMRRWIREKDPPRPSTRVTTSGGVPEASAERRRTTRAGLARELRGDLDWIVMKAMDKDRARRYGSPTDLAADLDRHLRNEPVTAGPPSAPYRLGKFVRRHRLGVAAGSMVTAALLSGLVLASVGLVRARRAERVASRQVELLISMVQTLDPGGAGGGTMQVSEVLGRAAERIEAELGDQPLVQARLKATMARILLNLGSYHEARPLLEEVVDVRRRLLGGGHRDVASSLRDLGELYGIIGEFERARGVLEQALAIHREVFGPEHPETAATLEELAFTLWRTGSFEQAGEPFARALAIRERAYGPDHPLVAETLFHQALLLRDTGELERAHADLQRAMAIREATFGQVDTTYAWMLENFGQLVAAEGDLEAARAHLGRALEIQEQIFGRVHFAVADPLLGLGRVELAARNYGLARQHFQRARTVFERLFGPDHHYLAVCLDGLGAAARDLGELDAARALFERGLELREAALGPEHPHVALSLANLGDLTRRSGALEESLAFFERRLLILEAARDPGSVDVARARVDVAALLARTGDHDRARERYALGIDGAMAALDRSGPDRGRDAYNLACVAALVGSRGDAVDCLRRALDLGFRTEHVLVDPDLDPLRGDGEFEAVAREMARRARSPSP